MLGITEQLNELKAGVVEHYYVSLIWSERRRVKELKAALMMQKNYRMHMDRKRFNIKKSAANAIKRVYKGHKSRVAFLLKRDEEHDLMQAAFYDEQSTLIQKWFRGYWHRKYTHDFHSRKLYLKCVAKNTEELRGQMEDYAKTKVMEEQKRKEEAARAEFNEIAKNLHHLVSTRATPGVYNSPFMPTGVKPQAFNVDIETHLRTAFKSTYHWKAPDKTNIEIHKKIKQDQFKDTKKWLGKH